MNKAYPLKTNALWIHNSRVHLFMYSALIVLTPFILLRNYMVQAISLLSQATYPALGMHIKVIPAIALVIAISLFVVIRKQITKLKLLAVAIVVLLDALAQQITDYYFGHHFYDLQQNWHYIAYGLYAYVIYRDLNGRGLPLYKIMLITYCSAIGLSAFDEAFQMFMSSRVFDVCDIGKDAWGAFMGMILVYFFSKSSLLFKDWKNIRHKTLKNYYRHPFTLMVLLLLLTFIFLSVGSLLSDSEYLLQALFLTVALFTLVFLIWHFSQFNIGKIVLLTFFVAAVLVQSFFYIKYRNKNIVYSQFGLTVYKGIPIPFFDIMIFQNGAFRLVDKKHLFNQKDRDFFLKKNPDILLISSGFYGKGGKGFPDPQHMFLYNSWGGKATQVIIQKNPEAFDTFNRLKNENKNVLFIIHNTC